MPAAFPRIDPARFADPDSVETQPVTLQVIKHAVVISTRAEPGDQVRRIASLAPEDHENTLVLLDLPGRVPIAVWESVAAAIGPGPRGIRLVVDGRSRELTTLAAGWLSERLDRPVTLADGPVVAGRGALLVGDRHDHRWRDYRPGRQSRPGPRRFPRPAWDDELTALIAGAGAGVACEPLPAGAWIRPDTDETDEAAIGSFRGRLLAAMPMRRGFPTLVLGAPGVARLRLEDVHRLRSLLPEAVRRGARMAGVGPIALPAGKTLGQALADLSGEETHCYTGIPVGGTAEAPEIRIIGSDGRPGPWPYALEVRHRPQAGLRPGAPDVTAHRPPFAGLTQVGPGAYRLRPDVVVEVVQAGLMLRPAQEGPQAVEVRRAGPDKRQNLIVVAGRDGNDGAGPLHDLARALIGQFDEASRRSIRLVTAAELLAGPAAVVPAGAVEAAGPLREIRVTGEPDRGARAFGAERDSAVPVGARVPTGAAPQILRDTAPSVESPATPREVEVSAAPETGPAASPPEQVPPRPVVSRETKHDPAPPGQTFAEGKLGFQPLPARQHRAVLPTRPIDEERDWLRNALGNRYGTLANEVARILSEHPGFEGLGAAAAEAVTDAVAVRLYLSPDGPRLNPSLRVAADGPHVPFARCIVSGLGRLASHRGPASFAVTVGRDAWQIYQGRPQLTEWGFLAAGAGPADPASGDTDVLVWSLTGRRTSLLDSLPAGAVPRVLFVPGTRLKILEAKPPTGQGRGLILMREVTARDLAGDEAARSAQSALDEMALASLRADHGRWPAPGARRPTATEHPQDLLPVLLPGLVRQ
ncbi:hypothetical protein KIH74_28160 [Kineosporia sp. J2-2]|uniref:Uncharacterized protein n=1 Tax=Kineosporia corallincola TaxID=2835133 RepID=A0ABS5TP19_9ACTN|nr:hypothetical protein [Kineosporia corallincola]MBT0772849.1 hypothetical protein [Kineosporia corallincola]